MRGFLLLFNLYVSVEISLNIVEIYKLYGLGLVKKKNIGLWSVKKTVGCLDPSNENSCSVSVFIMAFPSLIRVESLSSACVNSLEIAE